MNYEHERLVRMIIRRFEITGIAEDDLFQEGMLALLKAEKTYKEQSGAKFETYASVVIRNHIIDVIRMQKEEPIGLNEEIMVEEPSGDAKTEELLKILHEVLDSCSEFERAIFNAYFQGYSYQEICEIFGISKKKVDNTIQKIRKLAKANYAD